MTRIAIAKEQLARTLELLRAGGKRGEEHVALWLSGQTARTPTPVAEVYDPEQFAEVDNFHIPAHAMRSLMRHLAMTRRRILAQIHTHPGRAFHSDADADWAIVRHVGALSLVLPEFASRVTTENFLNAVKVYELSAEGEWVLRPNRGPDAMVEVTP